MDVLSEVTPVPRSTGDHAAAAVHKHMRDLILRGKLAPGTVLSQVDLAPRLGVSRTPLREALRQLQEEGLVKAEPQRRTRVVSFDPEELDSAYAQRIALEAIGVRLTVPNLTGADLENINAKLREVEKCADRDDLEGWQVAHRAFHIALVGAAGPELLRAITVQIDRGELYRGLYQASTPRSWTIGNAEHHAILEQFAERDAEAASRALASHLARTALALMAELAPDHEPRGVRAALAIVQANAPRGARRRREAVPR
jgi:DNA-binding GntR family transcriptional regulator